MLEIEITTPNQGAKAREIINSDRYSSFFHETNVEKLFLMYKNTISETAKSLGIGETTNRQFIANVLEYGRFLGMYENMTDTKDGIFGTDVSCLSQSGLNIALLGKGVCASQARFMRDLLQERNIDSVCTNVTFFEKKDEEEVPVGEHDVTLFELDGMYYYADPTWYNGTIPSLKGSNGLAKCWKYPKLDLYTLDFSQEEIEKACRVASNVAIKKLGIDKIAEELGLSELEDLNKQTTIMAFLEKNAISQAQSVDVASVDINGFEVEVGKAFELFLQQQSVPYSIHQSEKTKEENILFLSVLGKPTAICTRNILYKENNKLSSSLHQIQMEDKRRKCLHKTNEDIMRQYKESIKNARERVECAFPKS
ncbi:MAG: hypothetical protein LBC61_07375 [Candidatus Peribacteria bacterium]|jgi:hypothetical protein|nr:hypothetical protein [Candidatus Peribacteria bacterium]